MNKFLLIYVIFVVIWFLDICYGMIKTLWAKFWLSRGRCPRCFRTFWTYNNYGFEYSYCRNHIEERYYEDRTKVGEDI